MQGRVSSDLLAGWRRSTERGPARCLLKIRAKAILRRPSQHQERRARESNPQPVSRHHISSVAASHSLTLRGGRLLADPSTPYCTARFGLSATLCPSHPCVGCKGTACRSKFSAFGSRAVRRLSGVTRCTFWRLQTACVSCRIASSLWPFPRSGAGYPRDQGLYHWKGWAC